MHAYIDESGKGDRYFVVAVFVPVTQVRLAQTFVRGFIGPGGRRMHFVNARDDKRQKFITGLSDLGLSGCSCVSLVVGGSGQKEAREACLSLLVTHIEQKRATRVVFDRRDSLRDRQDRQFLAAAQRDGLLGLDVEYHHLDSRQELLLALPDAVAWCMARGGDMKRSALRLPTTELICETVTEKKRSARRSSRRKRGK